MIESRTTAIIALVCLLGGFLSGYKVENWRGEARARVVAEQALQARDTAIAAYLHLAGALSAANDQHTNELRVAQNETNRLRGLTAGGLRVRATCPDNQPPPGARVDSGTGAELDTTARQDYFALRDGIDHATAQLAACQDELKFRAQ